MPIMGDGGDIASAEVRIFLACPGGPVREAAKAVIERLAARDPYGHIVPVFFENYSFSFSESYQLQFQQELERAHIVVVALHDRLGTLLAGITGPISGSAVTGTQFELESALRRAQDDSWTERPQVFLFHGTGDLPLERREDAEARAERDRVTSYVEGISRVDNGAYRYAPMRFADLTQLRARLERCLIAVVDGRLKLAMAVYDGDPFRGLESYEITHGSIFRGRLRETLTLLSLLETRSDDGAAILWVIGASGCGKSSLVKAGLVPELLRSSRRPTLDPIVIRPAAVDNPLAVLRDELGAGEADTLSDLEWLSRRLDRRGGHDGPARVLIVVDQFEEILAPEIGVERRHEFVTALLSLSRLAQDKLEPTMSIVLTMGSEHWPRAGADRVVAALLNSGTTYTLLPPGDEAFKEIITEPVARVGGSFETDRERGSLAQVILDEVRRQSDSLPLLGHAMDQLWCRCRRERILTFRAFDELGGITGAITATAEAVIAEDPEYARALPALLVALAGVRLDADGGVVPRPAPLAELAGEDVVQRLAQRLADPNIRLIAIDAVGDRVVFRIAHEAVLLHWGRARRHLEAKRLDLETRDRLASEYRLRTRAGRSASLLEDGALLRAAEAMLVGSPGLLDATLTDFVVESAAQRDDRVAMESRHRSALLALFARSALDAERPERALGLLDLAAPDYRGERLRPLLDELPALVYDAVNRAPRLTIDWGGSLGPVTSITPSDCGSHYGITTAHTLVQPPAGSMRVVSASTGEWGHQWRVEFPLWSLWSEPGSDVVVCGSNGFAVRLPLADRPREILDYGHKHAHQFLADGRQVCSDHDARAIRLLEGDGRTVVREWIFDKFIPSVSFTSDGRHVVFADHDLAELREVGRDVLLHQWTPRFPVSSVRWVAALDDRSFLIGRYDGTVSQWVRGKEGVLREWLYQAQLEWSPPALSPDRRSFVAIYNDGSAALWWRESTRVRRVFRHEGAAITAVAFAVDGSAVLTGDTTGCVKVWCLSPRDAVRGWRHNEYPNDFGLGVIVSGNGRGEFLYNAVHSRIGQLTLWPRRPELEERWKEESQGQWLANGNILTLHRHGALREWNEHDAEPVRRHTARISGTALSADLQRVVVAHEDGVIRLFEVRPIGDYAAQSLKSHTETAVCWHGRGKPHGIEMVGEAGVLTLHEHDIVHLWAPESDEPVQTWQFDDQVIGLGRDASNSGFWIITTAGTVRHFRIAEAVVDWQVEVGPLASVCWAYGGEHMLLHGPGRIAMFSQSSRSIVGSWAADPSPSAMVPSPSGRFVAVGYPSGEVALLSCEAHAPIASWSFGRGVNACAVGAEGLDVAVVLDDGAVQFCRRDAEVIVERRPGGEWGSAPRWIFLEPDARSCVWSDYRGPLRRTAIDVAADTVLEITPLRSIGSTGSPIWIAAPAASGLIVLTDGGEIYRFELDGTSPKAACLVDLGVSAFAVHHATASGVAGYEGGAVRRFALDAPEHLEIWWPFTGKVSTEVKYVGFLENGDTIAATQHYVVVLRSGEREPLRRWKANWQIDGVAPCPGGRLLIAMGGMVRLWDPLQDLWLREWHFESSVTVMAASGSGHVLAVGFQDGAVHLIDADSGLALRIWEHTGTIEGLAFTDDDRQLLMVLGDGLSYVVGLHFDWECAGAHLLGARSLSPAERRQISAPTRRFDPMRSGDAGQSREWLQGSLVDDGLRDVILSRSHERLADAARRLRAGITRSPHDARAHYQLGEVLLRLSDGEAIAAFREALRLAPENGMAAMRLASEALDDHQLWASPASTLELLRTMLAPLQAGSMSMAAAIRRICMRVPEGWSCRNELVESSRELLRTAWSAGDPATLEFVGRAYGIEFELDGANPFDALVSYGVAVRGYEAVGDVEAANRCRVIQANVAQRLAAGDLVKAWDQIRTFVPEPFDTAKAVALTNAIIHTLDRFLASGGDAVAWLPPE